MLGNVKVSYYNNNNIKTLTLWRSQREDKQTRQLVNITLSCISYAKSPADW